MLTAEIVAKCLVQFSRTGSTTSPAMSIFVLSMIQLLDTLQARFVDVFVKAGDRYLDLRALLREKLWKDEDTAPFFTFLFESEESSLADLTELFGSKKWSSGEHAIISSTASTLAVLVEPRARQLCLTEKSLFQMDQPRCRIDMNTWVLSGSKGFHTLTYEAAGFEAIKWWTRHILPHCPLGPDVLDILEKIRQGVDLIAHLR